MRVLAIRLREALSPETMLRQRRDAPSGRRGYSDEHMTQRICEGVSWMEAPVAIMHRSGTGLYINRQTVSLLQHQSPFIRKENVPIFVT
jgi:hypothetical protein